MREYELLIAEYGATKAQIENLHRKLNGLKDDLVDYMESTNRKTLRTSQGGYLMQTTYIRQTSVKIDETGLRKRLGAKVFDKYTKKVVDRPRLEQAIEDGEVDAVAVQPFVTTKLSDPFLKFTMKEDKNEESDE